MRLALDWDDTLIDVETKEWRPGALLALRTALKAGHRVSILTSRALWPEGRAEVEQKLAEARLPIQVYAKPDADVYVDDKAFRFDGDWFKTMQELRLGAKRRAA